MDHFYKTRCRCWILRSNTKPSHHKLFSRCRRAYLSPSLIFIVSSPALLFSFFTTGHLKKLPKETAGKVKSLTRNLYNLIVSGKLSSKFVGWPRNKLKAESFEQKVWLNKIITLWIQKLVCFAIDCARNFQSRDRFGEDKLIFRDSKNFNAFLEFEFCRIWNLQETVELFEGRWSFACRWFYCYVSTDFVWCSSPLTCTRVHHHCHLWVESLSNLWLNSVFQILFRKIFND